MLTLGTLGLSSWPEPSSHWRCLQRSCPSCLQKTWLFPGTSRPCPPPGLPRNVSLRWSAHGPRRWPLCQSAQGGQGGPATPPGVSPDVCPGKAATTGWLCQGPEWHPLQKHNKGFSQRVLRGWQNYSEADPKKQNNITCIFQNLFDLCKRKKKRKKTLSFSCFKPKWTETI